MSANMNLMEIQSTIQELQEALLSAHPEMPTLLRKIHTKLKADPELVTLLSEEEIAQVINGLKVHTNVQLTSSAKKTTGEKKPSAASRLKALGLGAVSADDF